MSLNLSLLYICLLNRLRGSLMLYVGALVSLRVVGGWNIWHEGTAKLITYVVVVRVPDLRGESFLDIVVNMSYG